MTEVWYRYSDPWSAGDQPFCQQLPVVRHTPKCVILDEYGVERRVLKHARKRYAYPTKELALGSYIIRKKRQMQHASNTHDTAHSNLQTAEAMARGDVVERPSVFPFMDEART